MSKKAQERPRGGVIIDVRPYGRIGQYTLYWCIDPDTHAERALLCWTTPTLPQQGDELWWHRDHSPAWIPAATKVRTAFLPRVGRSFDPTAESLSLAR